MFNKTIIAPATPIAYSALAVVRISGPEAVAITQSITRLATATPLDEVASHTVHLAYLVSSTSQVTVDEILVTVFRAPRSYTGEDVVELSCHGNPVIVDFVIRQAVDLGAHLADPGEFTQRAFLMGKKDLTQAEAVADLIHAHSQTAIERSVRQIKGGFSERIHAIKHDLEQLLLYLEAELDFSEEQIDFLSQTHFDDQLAPLVAQLKFLEESFERSARLRRGFSLVLIGKPNVGKSSLLNGLLRTHRAIVTDIPGTTRDVVDAEMMLGEFCVRVVDTAGLCETKDPIEQVGVEKSREELSKADCVLFVLSGEAVDDDDRMLWSDIQTQLSDDQALKVIVNKKDCLKAETKRDVQKLISPLSPLFVSTLDLNSLKALEQAVLDELQTSVHVDAADLMINQRQYQLLQKALGSLHEAQQLELDDYQEVIVMSLKETLHSLADIVGEQYDADILDKIFANFCIGK